MSHGCITGSTTASTRPVASSSSEEQSLQPRTLPAACPSRTQAPRHPARWKYSVDVVQTNAWRRSVQELVRHRTVPVGLIHQASSVEGATSRSSSAGKSAIPATTMRWPASSQCSRATSVPQRGIPRMKLAVPSIGSKSHRHALVPGRAPCSSPSRASSGKDAWIDSARSCSMARSASVTGDPSVFDSAETPLRKWAIARVRVWLIHEPRASILIDTASDSWLMRRW